MSIRSVIALHDARTAAELAPVMFKLIAEAIPQELLVLMLRPSESELRSYSSRPQYQSMCDHHTAEGCKDDMWPQLSPRRPNLPVVRHSEYISQADLHKSAFYRNVMGKIGCEYGVSLVAWRKKDWLACLTIFRTKSQGDFLDDELHVLETCQIHFEAVINRIAALNEEKLGSHSLESFIWTLPTAGVILSWDLKALYWNAAAQEIGSEWKTGTRPAATKRTRLFALPGEIAAAILAEKTALAQLRTNTPGAPNMLHLARLSNPRNKELTADVSFMPAKSLTLSKGTFLVVFHRRHEVPDERESYDRLAELSRREREVVMLASVGKNSSQIAKSLGTSSATVRTQLTTAYRKLGIHSRLELMRMFAQNSLLEGKSPGKT